MVPSRLRTSVASRRRIRLVALVAAATAAGLTGCGSSGHHVPPTTTSRTTVAPTTTLPAGVQTTGTRTVLSPIGLNVRAGPSKTDRVLGTAAQGVVVTVTGYRPDNGGWYQVKGSTVSGWITKDPTLSAAGEFTPYSSGPLQVNALYPAAWTVTEAPPAGVLFRPATGPESIGVRVGGSLAAVGHGRPGYALSGSSTVVVCGVTSDLVTYRQAGAGSSATVTPNPGSLDQLYLVEVRLSLDAHHALSITGNLANLGPQLQDYRNFIYSVTFPFPRCNA